MLRLGVTREICAELGKKLTVLGDGGCQGCSTARVKVSPACSWMKQGQHLQHILQSGWVFLRSYFSFYGYILLLSTSTMCTFLEAPGFAFCHRQNTQCLRGTRWLWSRGWEGPPSVSTSLLAHGSQLMAHLHGEAKV